MGLLDGLMGKKKDPEQEPQIAEVQEQPVGKYADQECSFCGKLAPDKKWMGQYFHKKCLRSLKKGAKKML